MNITEKVKYGLAEIGHGTREVQFAFINHETGENLTPFCMCKDFFGDLFWSNETGNKVAIYGFKWEPNQDNGILKQDHLSVALRIRNRDKKDEIYDVKKTELESLVALFDQFNSSNKFKDFDAELSDDKKYIIITFDKAWVSKPYLCSALFLILRLGLTYDPKQEVMAFFASGSKNFISPNDETYFRSIKNRIQDLLSGKRDEVQKYSDYTVNTIHNNCGIVNYKGYKVI
jgi:hypothetical protein